MPDILKLGKKIDSIFKGHINLPVGFHFIMGICNYVKAINKSAVLEELIESERVDLARTRYKIPKARTDKQYNMLRDIIGEKLYINCHEDYMELFFISEALRNLRTKTPDDDLAEIDIIMKHDLQELENNWATDKNYYVKYYQDLRAKWEKVHHYLMGELADPQLQERVNQPKIEKYLELEYTNGILWIKGKSIIIKVQKRNTDEIRLLEYIFSNRKSLANPFSYIDIAENAFDDYGYDSSKKKWRRYYDICQRINKKIPEVITKSIKGEIKDFLIATSERDGSVSINKDFLPK